MCYTPSPLAAGGILNLKNAINMKLKHEHVRELRQLAKAHPDKKKRIVLEHTANLRAQENLTAITKKNHE